MVTLVSDIHGNLEALTAVLEDMRRTDKILCAGDIVGYGPNPNECCNLVREHEMLAVQGNHDIVCACYGELTSGETDLPEAKRNLAKETMDEMNEIARECAAWTYEELTEENREFLKSLPLERREDDVSMVHGSVGSDYDKLNTYIDEKFASSAGEGGELTPDEFYRQLLDTVEAKVLVVGHTHIPSKGYFFKHRYPILSMLPFFATERWVVNPGSVGQPRSGHDATYATVSMPIFPYLRLQASFRYLEKRVKHYSVPYDRETTLQKIEDNPGFNDKMTFMLSRWL